MYFVYVYIFFLNPKKKKNQDSQIFKKRKKRESVWTRGIGHLSHLKKKIFELGPLNFLVTFSKKKTHIFFSFKI